MSKQILGTSLFNLVLDIEFLTFKLKRNPSQPDFHHVVVYCNLPQQKIDVFYISPYVFLIPFFWFVREFFHRQRGKKRGFSLTELY